MSFTLHPRRPRIPQPANPAVRHAMGIRFGRQSPQMFFHQTRAEKSGCPHTIDLQPETVQRMLGRHQPTAPNPQSILRGIRQAIGGQETQGSQNETFFPSASILARDRESTSPAACRRLITIHARNPIALDIRPKRRFSRRLYFHGPAAGSSQRRPLPFSSKETVAVVSSRSTSFFRRRSARPSGFRNKRGVRFRDRAFCHRPGSPSAKRSGPARRQTEHRANGLASASSDLIATIQLREF